VHRYSINFNHETLPPFYWFDTEAKCKEKERVEASWVCGLPKVKGYFGFDRKVRITVEPNSPCGKFQDSSEIVSPVWQVTLHPAYTINNKGGCVDDDVLEWIDKIVAPAYPNVKAEWEYNLSGEVDADGLHPVVAGPVIIKTDYGPSRLVASEAGLKKRAQYHANGYLPYGGVPNGTAATQELDDLYGGLKAGGRDQADAIIAERTVEAAAIRKAATAKPQPVKLTNADLARIVNGLETDPPEKRPFSWTFAPENIAKTLDKLGYIDSRGWVTRAAINHPKVLAGAGCAEEATGATTLRSKRAVEQAAKHAVNLEQAATVGLLCDVLEVVAKKPLKKRTPVEVAPMSDSERAFMMIKESGASASSVFMYANGRSMWAPEVIDAALEGVLEKQAKAAGVAASKSDDFAKLQQSTKALIEGAVSFDALPTKDLVVVIRYLFLATATTGVTKVTKERNAMLHNISLFTHAQLAELLEKPPRITNEEIVGLPKLKVPAEGTMIEYAPFATTFGSVACDLGQQTPVSQPIWLGEALKFGSSCAAKLLEFNIVYHFAACDGGWAVGTIDEINTSARRTVTVEDENGLSGKLPANVMVHYKSDDDRILQRLSLDNYATDAESEVGSWALLVGPSPSARAKRPAACALEGPPRRQRRLLMPPVTTPAIDVDALSPEERRALMSQLAAMD